jgi:diketogulonate reductase-like aldo/keto reductase
VSDLTAKSTRKLNNGIEMPVIGLGTWKIPDGAPAVESVNWALEAGYRLIDTARMYKNEEGVGNAIKNCGLPRNEIFVTTKLQPTDMGAKRSLKAFDKSLFTLGLEYVDLYLIHWPLPLLRKPTWKSLQKIYTSGKCRAIGVSNFTVRHLQELLDETGIVPAVNQVEFHPYLFQKDLLAFCREHDIQLEAYSPLTHAYRMDDERIAAIGQKYRKTIAQIMLRWSLQHGNIVIPKSVHKERIIENISIFDFELSPEDMAAMDALNENHHFIWDPSKL